jgi:hypothetical protein
MLHTVLAKGSAKLVGTFGAEQPAVYLAQPILIHLSGSWVARLCPNARITSLMALVWWPRAGRIASLFAGSTITAPSFDDLSCGWCNLLPTRCSCAASRVRRRCCSGGAVVGSAIHRRIQHGSWLCRMWARWPSHGVTTLGTSNGLYHEGHVYK